MSPTGTKGPEEPTTIVVQPRGDVCQAADGGISILIPANRSARTISKTLRTGGEGVRTMTAVPHAAA